MVRWIMLIFFALTASAAAMTYYNVGLQETYYDSPSVRSGSAGIRSGGYHMGK